MNTFYFKFFTLLFFIISLCNYKSIANSNKSFENNMQIQNNVTDYSRSVFWPEITIDVTERVIHCISINKNGDIFAGAERFMEQSGGGIFRSINNGIAWEAVNKDMIGKSVLCLANSKNGFIFAGTRHNGLFYSTDNGKSWEKNNFQSTTVLSIAINSKGDIFVGTLEDGVFRSTDNGKSWQEINQGITNKTIYTIVFNSNDHILAGTTKGGVFLSKNNGESWEQINNEVTTQDVFSIALNENGDIYIGTSAGGLFRSPDNGISWEETNNNMRNNNVNSLAINKVGHIFAAIGYGGSNEAKFDNGVLRSTDGGNTWTEVNNGFKISEIQSLVINDRGHIFAGTRYSGIYISTDNGDNWTEVNNNLLRISPIGRDIIGHGYIFPQAFAQGVISHESTIINKTLPASDIRSICVNNKGDVFVGTYNKGIFRMMRNSDDLQEANDGLKDQNILSLAINVNGDVYAGTNQGGVFLSTNNGMNWREVNNGLTDAMIRSIAINDHGQVFVGTAASGIFRSNDNSDSWIKINNGLSNFKIRSLVIDDNDHLLTQTLGGNYSSYDNGENWTKAKDSIAVFLEDWYTHHNLEIGFEITFPTFFNPVQIRRSKSRDQVRIQNYQPNQLQAIGDGFVKLEKNHYSLTFETYLSDSLDYEQLKMECADIPLKFSGFDYAYTCKPKLDGEGSVTHLLNIWENGRIYRISIDANNLGSRIVGQIFTSIRILATKK